MRKLPKWPRTGGMPCDSCGEPAVYSILFERFVEPKVVRRARWLSYEERKVPIQDRVEFKCVDVTEVLCREHAVRACGESLLDDGHGSVAATRLDERRERQPVKKAQKKPARRAGARRPR